jgi:endoglucanase
MRSKFSLNRFVAFVGVVSVFSSLMYLPAATLLGTGRISVAEAAVNESINNWWPVEGATVSGVQPFKATVSNTDISQYTMYWQVDGGQLNVMPDSWDGSPHKEASVDLSGWSWKGSGPYGIIFTAKNNNGETLATKNIQISLSAAASVATPAITPAPAPVPVAVIPPVVAVVAAPVIAPAVVTPAVVTTVPVSSVSSAQSAANLIIKSWWPTDGSVVQGTQPFKVVVLDKDIQTYDLYWKTGDGSLVRFDNNYTDSPHKETSIDFTGWTWLGRGPYVIDLVAKSGDQAIATGKISIYNGAVSASAATSVTASTSVVAPAPVTSPAPLPVKIVNTNNPLAALPLFVDSNSNAAAQVSAWQSSRPQDALTMKKIANASVARWFGNWDSNIGQDVSDYVKGAQKAGAMPVMVLYNIPQRDCGSYSAGGADNASSYKAWINSVHQAIGSGKAAVILEPDALAQMSCLSGADQNTRISLLQNAISTLKSGSGTTVYVDAGNSSWQSVQTMTERLNKVNISQADGFSLNVSNFYTASDSLKYGDDLSRALGGAHYVVDTGRSGLGSNNEWCNPSGRALGPQPTTATNDPAVDAFLWIKSPGESDGNCNGGPNAGVWWPDYALGLAQRAAY